jgi:hypothetical protein
MVLGTWLAVVGICDLLRAAADATSTRRRSLLVALGLALLAAAATWLRFPARWWWTAGAVWALGLVAWLLTSSVALDPRSTRRGSWRVAAFVSFAAPFAVLLGLGGGTSPPGPQVSGTLIAEVGARAFLVMTGVALLQLSTGNLLVRLLLDAIGVPAVSNEKTLRGGRLLGPMERLFILVLAVAGQLTAASVVVAAKGLLRWPELRGSREDGPSDLSEYFLIGSFASWLLAVGGWVVVRLL